MLTGVFSNGVFNALFLLRGSGKVRIKYIFSSFMKSTSSEIMATPDKTQAKIGNVNENV